LGHEILYVAKARIANGAETEHRLVATVACAKHHLAWRLGTVAEENAALHLSGLRVASHLEKRRSKVDGFKELIAHAADFELFGGGKIFRPADDQGDAQPVVVTELFATHVALPVVGH